MNEWSHCSDEFLARLMVDYNMLATLDRDSIRQLLEEVLHRWNPYIENNGDTDCTKFKPSD